MRRLDELAQSVPPPRDLWPAIALGIEAHERELKQSGESQAPGAAKRRPAWWMPAMGMAAAVALVSIGVFIGQRTSTVAPSLVAGTQQTGDPAMVQAALRDANYRKQRDALLVEVNNRLKSMPEDDRAKVAASLKTLQRSISDIEAALGKDPANALLQELLVNSCQEEMRALTAVRDSGSQET
ncbi:MAG TPA: anti-sigma factor [Steroidobacteraceae bacterium]|nr:anti-sigma factor [Steroidobacteraceae bacterium]